VAEHTILAPYNDLDAVERALNRYAGDVAALIVEPVAGNMGLVPPEPGFLEGLRELCDRNGILLVFDEVISGFRVGAGGAQAAWGVRPDLTCLGKIIGGGLPVGAYGGRADLMEYVSPAGPVYQAGTLSGNPLAMAAGLWSLSALTRPLYKRLARLGAMLATGLAEAARDAGVALHVNALASMLTPFFATSPVRDYRSALQSNSLSYAAFFRALLARGIYPPPSQFEAWFLSAAHTETDVRRTIAAAREAFREIE
jgi:glutamate-1-semialdehyde 2,1-aminomutase